MRALNTIRCLLLSLLFMSTAARAAEDALVTVATEGPSEEYFMVSNGQGISSPSYWNALIGENPAGLVHNQSIKFQFGAGSYSGDGLVGSSSNTHLDQYSYTSEGVLIGNGIIGAGLEFQNYPNYFGTGVSQGKIHWGLAGCFKTIWTTFALSSHTTLNGGGTTFDLGVMIEPLSKVRLGFMIPDFARRFDTFAGGITFLLSDMIDVVVDADYNSKASLGAIKPGATIHRDWLQMTMAYGLRYLGRSYVILSQGLSAGVGLKIFNPLLLNYEYRGIPEHRLGLTLRFN